MTTTVKLPELKKRKKYYKVDETVYLKVLERNGTVKSINVEEKEAVIAFVDNDGGVTEDAFKFWELDKVRGSNRPTVNPVNLVNLVKPVPKLGQPLTPKKSVYQSLIKKKVDQPTDDVPVILVRYLTDIDGDFKELREISGGDWIDVSAAKDIKLSAGEDYRIPLGFAMQLPPNKEAHLLPRSGTFGKFGIILVNSKGVIDNSYSGNNDEWLMHVYATGDTFIPRGTRIGQFRLMDRMGKVRFKSVNTLGNQNRGSFGSTGN